MLKRVSIQNFKSLKDVTLDLQKVNLLIGPNNSGKTNFLKALEFAGNINDQPLELNENILFKKYWSNSIKLHFAFDDFFPFDDDSAYEHFIIMSKIERGSSILEHNNILRLSKPNNSNELDIDFDDVNDFLSEERSQDFESFVQNIKFYFGSVYIHKPDPNLLAQASIVGTGAKFVNANASNLIAFFDYIRDDQPDIFTRIKRDLKKCIPEFSEINFQSVAATDELIKQFGPGTYKKIGLTHGKQKVKYWADELSEGTLYFLALLCIINQPNPPKLLLLEEPEKGIHPRRLFEVMQFIFSLVENKEVQVIMTTHSPIVVDMFKDMTESVFVFDKDDEGATHVKNLQRDIIEPETARSKELGIEPPHYTDSLGDAWTIGFLGGVPK